MDLTQINGRTVKVGSKIYKIKLKKSIKKDQLLGLSSHYSDTIWLSTKQSPASFADTLIHEILHCLWYSYGVSYVLDAQEIEEFIVNSFASGLMTAYIDNPWLLIFLDEVRRSHDILK